MSGQDILFEEVDRYLSGEMDQEAKLNFENKLVDDPKLRNEVELQRMIIKSVRKEQLEKIIQKEESKLRRSIMTRRLITFGSLAIAASLTGFFYIGFINNCVSLADRHYVAYANISQLPSRGKSLSTQSDSLFFDALRQLEEGNNRRAAKQLADLQNKQSELHVASESTLKWYLSLAYLKCGKKHKTKILLHQILEETTDEYKIEARKLLKELEN